MTPWTLLKTVFLSAIVALALTGPSQAATVYPAGDGPAVSPYGTVDAQDVQAAFGWSNKQLTDVALASPDHLLFRYELITRYRITCDNGELYLYDLAYVMRLNATPQGEHNVQSFSLMSPGLTSAPPPTPVPSVGETCPWDTGTGAVVTDVTQPAPVVRAVTVRAPYTDEGPTQIWP